jgi:hypothetical protein
MSTKAAKHVYAVMKRRLGDIMKAKPEGGDPIEEIEAWGLSFVKGMVSRTSGAHMPQITLTVLHQNEYHEAARAAEEAVVEDGVGAFFASATALLDPFGRQDWLEWAGSSLLPQTAQAQAEAEEKAKGERVQQEQEDRAAGYERRRLAVEVSFEAGELTNEEMLKELEEIYAEEDAERGEQEEGPPPTEFEDEAQGVDETEPDASMDDPTDDNDATRMDTEPIDEGVESTTVDDGIEPEKADEQGKVDEVGEEDQLDNENEQGEADEQGETEAGENDQEDNAAPSMPTITVPGGRLLKRKDRDEDSQLRPVEGPVSPSLNASQHKLTYHIV